MVRLPPALLLGALLLAAGPAVAADVAEGAKTFKTQCGVCHTSEKGGPNRIGPNLFGTTGRKAGQVQGYAYSNPMKNSGLVWDEATLKAYLAAPAKIVPGTKMAFAGFSNPAEEANVIAFLESLK